MRWRDGRYVTAGGEIRRAIALLFVLSVILVRRLQRVEGIKKQHG
jgi:hypothetical protein